MASNRHIELLNRILSLGRENEWVEFKLNKVSPEETGQLISGLANSACLARQPFGFLIYGIEDGSLKVKGTETFFLDRKKGKEELQHWLAQRLNPRIDFQVLDFYHEDKKMSILQIPAAKSQPVRFMHKGYIRIGTITRALEEFPEKEKKIWLNAPLESFEAGIAMKDVARQDLQKFLSFDTYFELLGRPFPTSLEPMVEIFMKERLVRNNLGNYDITNLGAILFAKNLDVFEALFRKSIRLVLYKGKNRVETEREFSGNRGYALEFSRVVELISSLLPQNEVVENALRKEVSLYPEIALRELIANALIHQDFLIKGTGPMVEVFSDRIEITNPGKPLIETLRFIDHNPESRNERLAHLMRRLNICEERGSGIDKVIASCEVYQLPAPEFLEGNNYTRVKVFAPKAFRMMDKDDKIRACYQHCSLKYVTGERMVNASLRERFDIPRRNYPMVSRVISDTIDAGLVKEADPENRSRRHARYVPYWA